jgi:hypothetical protein
MNAVAKPGGVDRTFRLEACGRGPTPWTAPRGVNDHHTRGNNLVSVVATGCILLAVADRAFGNLGEQKFRGTGSSKTHHTAAIRGKGPSHALRVSVTVLFHFAIRESVQPFEYRPALAESAGTTLAFGPTTKWGGTSLSLGTCYLR